MLEGASYHRDSLGNSGLIGPGDAQWMTSGRGIMHEEMPRRGPEGTVNGLQLWVNLPAAQKMTAPRYQDVSAETIPQVTKDGVTVRIVAARPLYVDVAMSPGTSFVQSVRCGHTALAYVFDGAGRFGADGDLVEAVRMAVFEDGDQIKVQSDTGVRFLLIAGAPFREPIVPYGPFVMNTVEEIQQAFMELRQGTFIKP
jgi:redox-sensitive bicupin YhaK (pirin superfamily)